MKSKLENYSKQLSARYTCLFMSLQRDYDKQQKYLVGLMPFTEATSIFKNFLSNNSLTFMLFRIEPNINKTLHSSLPLLLKGNIFAKSLNPSGIILKKIMEDYSFSFHYLKKGLILESN